MPSWDERLEAMSGHYLDVRLDKYHIDILTARYVLSPARFDVVVASNLFGDILSDLGPACTATIGIAPSANLNPERTFPLLFEPVHGSAPDILGQSIANPIAMVWSGAMMPDFLGNGNARYLAANEAIIRPSSTSWWLGRGHRTWEERPRPRNLARPLPLRLTRGLILPMHAFRHHLALGTLLFAPILIGYRLMCAGGGP